MPELPEVETVKRDLEKLLPGQTIKDVEIGAVKLIKEPGVSEFKRRIRNKKIKDVRRRGKLLIFELSDGFLTFHLKLTGQLIYGKKDSKAKVSFLLSGGKYLNFNDLRLFGEIRLVAHWRNLSQVRRMGLEPLEADFTLETFKGMLKGKKSRIKPLLMDQAFIAGLGNLYTAEVLFRSRVHPARAANTLKIKETEELFRHIKEVLREGIKYRGSSVDDYRDASGKKGFFAPRLQVYGREGESCSRCKTKIDRIKTGGRSSYFCPKCQKL